MPHDQTSKWLSGLTVKQRVDLAKLKTKRLVDQLQYVLQIHESNKLLVFSDVIAQQIPPSYAAHTFKILQRTQYEYELIRLCALWDAPRENRESIPTVAALIDHPTVKRELMRETESFWGDEVRSRIVYHDAPDEDSFNSLKALLVASEKDFGCQQARSVNRWLSISSRMSKKIRSCGRFMAMADHRNHHLAHSLDESAVRTSASVVKYGDEKWLIEITARAVKMLYLGVCGTDFDVAGARRIDQKNASMFWNGVKVDVLG